MNTSCITNPQIGQPLLTLHNKYCCYQQVACKMTAHPMTIHSIIKHCHSCCSSSRPEFDAVDAASAFPQYPAL